MEPNNNSRPLVHNLSWENEQITLELNNKIILRSLHKYSFHDQQQNIILTLHARVILLIFIFWELVQTLPERRDSIQKWRWLNVSLGIKFKKSFQTVQMCILFRHFCEISFCRDLGTGYIVTTKYIITTAFQSYLTTMSCLSEYGKRARNATKQYRGQFCYVIKMLFSSNHLNTLTCWCNPSLGWNYKIVRILPDIHQYLDYFYW